MPHLTHENIIRIHNLDVWEGQTFILMEYADGATLAHKIVERDSPMTIEESLPLLRQIASAIDYTHSQNPPVVHRDLKPQNIFLTQNGMVKVADFGLARCLSDSTSRVSRTSPAGALAYMAPEQNAREGNWLLERYLCFWQHLVPYVFWSPSF